MTHAQHSSKGQHRPGCGCDDCYFTSATPRLLNEAAFGYEVDDDRAESDRCERGTRGCCVNHTKSPGYDACQPW